MGKGNLRAMRVEAMQASALSSEPGNGNPGVRGFPVKVGKRKSKRGSSGRRNAGRNGRGFGRNRTVVFEVTALLMEEGLEGRQKGTGGRVAPVESKAEPLEA